MPIAGPGCRNASARVRLVGEAALPRQRSRASRHRDTVRGNQQLSAFGAKAEVRWSPRNFAF